MHDDSFASGSGAGLLLPDWQRKRDPLFEGVFSNLDTIYEMMIAKSCFPLAVRRYFWNLLLGLSGTVISITPSSSAGFK